MHSLPFQSLAVREMLSDVLSPRTLTLQVAVVPLKLMLGATFYRIGVFNVPGTLVGALLVNVINNGMVLIGAKTWQQYVVQGAVMLVAVTIITILNVRARKGVR